MKNWLIIITVAIFLFSCEKEKTVDEIPVTYGNLKGNLTNKFGNPIANATVVAESEKGKNEVKSNSEGVYSFSRLPAIAHQVSVQADNYIEKTSAIRIVENQITELDFELESGDLLFSISDSLFNLPERNGWKEILINSNSNWEIINNSGWISIDKQKGSGNDVVRLSWPENLTDSIRSDSVYFKAGSISKKVIINQQYKFRIVSYKAVIGNSVLGIADSIYIRFNSSIKTVNIKSHYNLCEAPIYSEILPDEKTVRFFYSCGRLGNEYAFTIMANKKDGETGLSEYLSVPFYDKVLNVNGNICSFTVVNSENLCWVATRNPNKLYGVSLNEFAFVYEYNLSFNPEKVVNNPFNNNLYVSARHIDEQNYIDELDNKIYVLSKTSGAIIKIVNIQKDDDDHPQSPAICPADFCFAKNGMGLLLLTANQSSNTSWKFIDTSKNDTVYIDNYNKEKTENQLPWKKVEPNYDGTMFMVVSDTEITQVSSRGGIYPPSRLDNSGGGIDFIVTNKKEGKTLVAQTFRQFIQNNNGVSGKKTSISDLSCGDFYYGNLKNHVFTFEENVYRFIDYNEANILIEADVQVTLKNMLATTDGKFVFSFDSGEANSRLIRFTTAGLMRN